MHSATLVQARRAVLLAGLIVAAALLALAVSAGGFGNSSHEGHPMAHNGVVHTNN